LASDLSILQSRPSIQIELSMVYSPGPINTSGVGTNPVSGLNIYESSRTSTMQSKTPQLVCYYEGWNFNSGNYLFTTDTK